MSTLQRHSRSRRGGHVKRPSIARAFQNGKRNKKPPRRRRHYFAAAIYREDFQLHGRNDKSDLKTVVYSRYMYAHTHALAGARESTARRFFFFFFFILFFFTFNESFMRIYSIHVGAWCKMYVDSIPPSSNNRTRFCSFATDNANNTGPTCMCICIPI